MHVAMLIWTYWPGPEGGAERQCRGLARELVRCGHACTILTSRSAGAAEAASDDGGVRVLRFGPLCPSAERLGARALRLVRWTGVAREARGRAAAFWILLPVVWLARLGFLAGLAAAARRGGLRPAVLHVQESSWLAGVGVWLGRRWGIPVICKERSTPVLSPVGYDTPLRRRWDRLRRQAHFVALHDGMRAELEAEGVPAGRIAVIPNGVDVPTEAADPRVADEVLMVGNLSQGSPRKGFDVLLAAWALVHRERPAARLVVAGGGDRAPWERMADGLGCRESVRFAGPVPDPGPLYRRAALFVLPSRNEGMSNALLEAQANGLPAVATDIAANRAVVEDGVTGRLVAPGDAAAFAAAVLALLRDPPVREAMGRAARVRAAREFGRAAVTDRLLALYEARMRGGVS